MIETLNYFHYNTIDSTNEEAKRLIDAGKIKDIAVVIAEKQTKGKGTHARTWISPKGAGIYLSIIRIIARSKATKQSPNELRNEIASGFSSPRNDALVMSAAIACVEAIKKICNLETKIKPINDIYALGKNGKKLGGILIETRMNENGINALITGIGINTHVACRDVARNVSTSIEELMQEDFKQFSKENLIQKIIEKVCFYHSIVFNGKNNEIHYKYESLI